MSDAISGVAQEMLHIAPPFRMIEVVDPHPHRIEKIVVRGHMPNDQFALLLSLSVGSPILAIERYIEHRAKFSLESQRLYHQLLRAGVVVARSNNRKRGIARGKERLTGMKERVVHAKAVDGLIIVRTALWGKRSQVTAVNRQLVTPAPPRLYNQRE